MNCVSELYEPAEKHLVLNNLKAHLIWKTFVGEPTRSHFRSWSVTLGRCCSQPLEVRATLLLPALGPQCQGARMRSSIFRCWWCPGSLLQLAGKRKASSLDSEPHVQHFNQKGHLGKFTPCPGVKGFPTAASPWKAPDLEKRGTQAWVDFLTQAALLTGSSHPSTGVGPAQECPSNLAGGAGRLTSSCILCLHPACNVVAPCGLLPVFPTQPTSPFSTQRLPQMQSLSLLCGPSPKLRPARGAGRPDGPSACVGSTAIVAI